MEITTETEIRCAAEFETKQNVLSDEFFDNLCRPMKAAIHIIFLFHAQIEAFCH